MAFAIYKSDFSSALISVDGRSALFSLDQAEADALELCIDHLKAKPECARLDFYRDLLGDRPLCGPDGILAQLIEP